MSSDLYAQIRMIEQQCRMRSFTEAETRELLQLCPYAFAQRFPQRNGTAVRRGGRVLTAH